MTSENLNLQDQTSMNSSDSQISNDKNDNYFEILAKISSPSDSIRAEGQKEFDEYQKTLKVPSSNINTNQDSTNTYANQNIPNDLDDYYFEQNFYSDIYNTNKDQQQNNESSQQSNQQQNTNETPQVNTNQQDEVIDYSQKSSDVQIEEFEENPAKFIENISKNILKTVESKYEKEINDLKSQLAESNKIKEQQQMSENQKVIDDYTNLVNELVVKETGYKVPDFVKNRIVEDLGKNGETLYNNLFVKYDNAKKSNDTKSLNLLKRDHFVDNEGNFISQHDFIVNEGAKRAINDINQVLRQNNNNKQNNIQRQPSSNYNNIIKNNPVGLSNQQTIGKYTVDELSRPMSEHELWNADNNLLEARRNYQKSNRR